MDTPKLAMLMIAAIGLFYVVLPIVVYTYRALRGPRTVTCPATGLAEDIELDAWHAAVTAMPGPPRLYVTACTGWPARGGCDRGCLPGLRAAAHPADTAS